GMRMRQNDRSNRFPTGTDLAQPALELPRPEPHIDEQSGAVEFQKTCVPAAAAGQYRPSCRHLAPPVRIVHPDQWAAALFACRYAPRRPTRIITERPPAHEPEDQSVDNLPSAELLENTHDFPGP